MSMTVKQIKESLDELNVAYDDKLNKEELLKLLNDNKAEEPNEQTEQETETETKSEEKKKTWVVVYPRWKDVQDNNRIYKKNDIYDHEGKTEERLEELSTKNNNIGEVLIKETE